MGVFTSSDSRTRLLVSVRNAAETRIALDGGADWIDVKEPSRGALGTASLQEIEAVVAVVSEQVPVSIAAGELCDLPANEVLGGKQYAGVQAIKLGMAGMRLNSDWKQRWLAAVSECSGGCSPHPVAVVYADWQSCAAPSPTEILSAAIEANCPALLVDTHDKARGGLFDVWPETELAAFVAKVRSASMAIVLAGSLRGEAIAKACGVGADLVGVRGAICTGGREKAIDLNRVKQVCTLVKSVCLERGTGETAVG